MVQANELRIGNIVNYDAGEDGIMPCTLDATDILAISEKPKYAALHSGIPLSADVLEACGFKNDNLWQSVGKGLIYTKGPYYICAGEVRKDSDSLQDYYNFDDKLAIADGINHLHQLQNLYFALTGTELTINLTALQGLKAE